MKRTFSTLAGLAFVGVVPFQLLASSPATTSQATAILEQLHIIDALLDQREQLAAGKAAETPVAVAAGVPPAGEGGILPPGYGDGMTKRDVDFSDAAPAMAAPVRRAGSPAPRQAGKPDVTRPRVTTKSTLTGQPVIEVGGIAPCSGEIVLPMTLAIAPLPGGLVRVSGQGTPNTWHAIQARDDLFTGRWAEIASVPADGAGTFTVDLAAPAAPVTLYFRALVDSCPPCDPTVAKALVYVNGFYDWDTLAIKEPEQVCLTELGIYDANGSYVTNHYGNWATAGSTYQGYHLTGRYLETSPTPFALAEQIPFFVSLSNDFRVNPWGDADFPPDRAVLWGGEANLYYWITEYRRKVFSPEFITELNLDAQTDQTLRHVQYRQDGLTGDSGGDTLRFGKPILKPRESFADSTYGGRILPFSNQVWLGSRTRRSLGTGLDVISHAFDPEISVGEYAGLFPFWLAKTNHTYPFDLYCMDWYRNNPSSIAPCINDGVNAWAGYTLTGNPEVYQTYSYNLRKWGGRTCDTPMTPPCERGRNIDNVMMYEQGNNSGDQVFPFDNAYPGQLTQEDGPRLSDAGSLYFAAVFYDLELEAGLGWQRANLLFFKTLSEVTNTQQISMSQFGNLVMHSARLLWPDTNGLSRYERPIASVLTSRGIPLYGAPNIVSATYPSSAETILPTPIGSPATLQTYTTNVGFGSLHPDKQTAMSPNLFAYGGKRIFRNQYTAPDSDYAYMTYSLFKHSKYGPCDKLMFTDGTFSPNSGAMFGQYNGDGTYLATLTGRSLGNKSVFIPGSLIRFNHFRMKCATEAEASYFEDVHPFGWKIISQMKNGFTFTATRLGETATNVTYQLDIFDPSLTLTGPRTGPATYAWDISDYLGHPPFQQTNQTVQVTLAKNEPIKITVTRDRSGIVDVLVKEDRANDLDRESGRAFLMDCLNPDGNGNCL